MSHVKRSALRALVAVLPLHVLGAILLSLATLAPVEAASLNCTPPPSGNWNITGPVRCEGTTVPGPSIIFAFIFPGGDLTLFSSDINAVVSVRGGAFAATDSSIYGAEFFQGDVQFVRSAVTTGRADAGAIANITIVDSSLQELRIRPKGPFSWNGITPDPHLNLTLDYPGLGFLHITNTSVVETAFWCQGIECSGMIENSTFNAGSTVDEGATATLQNVIVRGISLGSPSFTTVEGGRIDVLIFSPRGTTTMSINSFSAAPSVSTLIVDDSGQYRVDLRNVNIGEWQLRPLGSPTVTINNPGLHLYLCEAGQDALITYNGGYIDANVAGCRTTVTGSRLAALRVVGLDDEEIAVSGIRFGGLQNGTVVSNRPGFRVDLSNMTFDPDEGERLQIYPSQNSHFIVSDSAILLSAGDSSVVETTNTTLFRAAWSGSSTGILVNSDSPGSSVGLTDQALLSCTNSTLGPLAIVGDSPGDHVTIRGTLGFIFQGPVPNFHPQSTLTRVYPARFGSCGGARFASGATISARRGGVEVFSGAADANGFIEIPIDFTAVNQNDPIDLFVDGAPAGSTFRADTSPLNLVKADVTPPSVNAGPDISVPLQTPSGSVVTIPPPTVMDDCDASPTVVSDTPAVFPPGTTTVTFSANDQAGNTGTDSLLVHVTYTFDGFLPPVRNDGSSIFQSGRVVPLKFRLLAANGQAATGAVARVAVFRITDQILGTVEEITPEAAGKSNTDALFRFSAGDGAYIYDLDTTGFAAGTYRVEARIDDGTTHAVLVSVRK